MHARAAKGRDRAQGMMNVLLAGASVVFLDLVLTAVVGGGPQVVVARSAVLLVCVPIISWIVVGRYARRSQAREHELQTRQDLVRDPANAVFLEIFAHPKSCAPPLTSIGTGYEDAMGRFAERWQAGEIRDLVGGLRDVDRQINALLHRPMPRDGGPTDDVAVAWRGSQLSGPDLRAAYL